jgi:capsular polysaccharide biosynthesis protein
MKLLKNATIIPLEGTMDFFTGGVFSSDGQFIEDSLLDRGKPAELQKPIQHLSGTYIYGGCLFRHFGHFIWESLSRLYTIRQCKESPILFISPDDGYREFFKLLGVNNEIFLINVPSSVENLIYSHPGSSLAPLYITDEQINALKYYNFNKNKKNTNEKIWLSRSKLLFGTVINELSIEKILAIIGYKIIYPEMLLLQEQVRLISTSDIVAGFDGSQFYSLLFAEDISSKIHIFNRRNKIPDAIPYVLQKRNIDFELHNFTVEYICGEGAWSYYIHSEPEKIVEVLRKL